MTYAQNSVIEADATNSFKYRDEHGNQQVTYNKDIVYKAEKLQNLPDPSNLFMVDIENEFDPSKVAFIESRNEVPYRKPSVEEVLMYDVLQAIWINGKWVRYTANSIATGSIKVGHPSMNEQGNVMYFISNIPGGVGGLDIYYSIFDGKKWSDPKNMGLIVNTSGDETFPVIEKNNNFRYISNNNLVYITGISQYLNLSTIEQEKIKTTYTLPDKPAPEIVKPTPANVPTTTTNNTTTKPATVSTIGTTSTLTDNKSVQDYRIQLGVFKTPNWDLINDFKTYGSIFSSANAQGLTTVQLGNFSDIDTAWEVVKKVRSARWFENAYIIGINQQGETVLTRK
jgi:cell division septation protein DedD